MALPFWTVGFLTSANLFARDSKNSGQRISHSALKAA